nr:hypothetical protein [bacterium]
WPLRNETLELGTTRGVSNLAEESSQSVTVGSGVLFVIADAGQE